MFGSSSGEPYWAHATAASPSSTSAAWALPSRTRRSFQGRPFSPSGLPTREWNHVHQQPPNPIPLCFSARRANASHVDASSARIAYSLMHPPFPGLTEPPTERPYSLLPGHGRACRNLVRRGWFCGSRLMTHSLTDVGIANLFTIECDAEMEHEGFRIQQAGITKRIGAELLAGNVYEVDPGKKLWPYHLHHANEEWLIVLRGRLKLRTPEGEQELSEGDVACFVRGGSGAHQVRNA